MLPYRLDILSCIPETKSPSEYLLIVLLYLLLLFSGYHLLFFLTLLSYSFLLPIPDVEWSEKKWREEDWVETVSMLEKLGLDRARLDKDIATVCEVLSCFFTSWHFLTELLGHLATEGR